MSLIYSQESYVIRGAAFEVYRSMGSGFLESVYQECLAKEFRRRRIPFLEQPEVVLYFHDQPLSHTFRPDFICFDKVVVELKAAQSLSEEHRAQLQNYLVATRLRLGLLMNFGHYPRMELERIVR